MKKILFLSSLALLVVTGCSLTTAKSAKDILSPDEAKAKAEEFINNNLMQPGSTATVKEVADEGDLYKVVVDVGGQDVDAYISKDGAKFFPQVMNIGEIENQNQPENSSADKSPSVNVPKADKPAVELFVMSHCPYGTQIEKGILPVVETLGDKIDFSLKFCDYAMHGQKELNEELQQYCVQQQGKSKLIAYLSCFLEAGDSASCLAPAGINQAELNSCIAATDREYKVTANYNDQSTWQGQFPVFNVYKNDNDKYGVAGSPTLVINGTTVSSGRSSAALLNTICASFSNQPEQCQTSLPATTPAPGFGTGTGSNTDATCN